MFKKKKERNNGNRLHFEMNVFCVCGLQTSVPPFLVCQQRVRLHPGGDTRINWEAVLATGSLKLSNLRENLKLLSGQKENKKTPPQVKNRKTNTTTHFQKHEEEEDTYAPVLLKVNKSSLQRGKQPVLALNTVSQSIMCHLGGGFGVVTSPPLCQPRPCPAS